MTLGTYKAEFNCQICAYCLMKNHVHLLIRIGQEDLQHFMRKVGAKYVYWYNWKYDRVGGLFQDRYKSEPVEDDGYFLTVLRYIHQNPVKAGRSIRKAAIMSTFNRKHTGLRIPRLR
jgi:REP element-mobilizing transposase RayT